MPHESVNEPFAEEEEADSFIDTAVDFLSDIGEAIVTGLGATLTFVGDTLSTATAGITATSREIDLVIPRARVIAARFLRLRMKEAAAELENLQGGIVEALQFGVPAPALPEDLFEKLAELLINPTRIPGEPCLAPAPLLRDLLDLALGRAGGVLGDIFGSVGETVEDFLFPAFGTAEALAGSVQAVLDDPITAALNLILGQRGKIECETVGEVGVGVGVIERQIKRLEDALAGALP